MIWATWVCSNWPSACVQPLRSWTRLEHYRGHLLNWYDSQTLTALPPRYVSTVDSGNLAACLIALKQGCLALTDAPLLGNTAVAGVARHSGYSVRNASGAGKKQPACIDRIFRSRIDRHLRALSAQPKTSRQCGQPLSPGFRAKAGKEFPSLDGTAQSHPNLNPEFLAEVQLYLNLMHHHLQDMQRGLDLFAPWLSLLDATPASRAKGVTAQPFMNTPAWQDLVTACRLNCPRWTRRKRYMTTSVPHWTTSNCRCEVVPALERGGIVPALVRSGIVPALA